MAKFIKSKFRVIWGTVFSFFYGIFATDISAQEAEDNANDETGPSVEESSKDEALDPGAIAAAVAAAAASAQAANEFSAAAAAADAQAQRDQVSFSFQTANNNADRVTSLAVAQLAKDGDNSAAAATKNAAFASAIGAVAGKILPGIIKKF